MTIDALRTALAGRYDLQRELGAGGMATVYLALDLKHVREVAIKVLRGDLGAALGAERFLAEVRTTARLQHPHILPLLDSGDIDGTLFYVMPYVRGETLRARLQRECQLSLTAAAQLTMRIGAALAAAHGAGVLHRDVKPENVLLNGDEPFLADFGIARPLASLESRLTQTGLALGTPAYMSPEQALGDRELTRASDVYALASVAFEMLTGQPPFVAPTYEASIVRRVTEDAPRAKALRPDVPASWDQALADALLADPLRRTGEVGAFTAVFQSVGPIAGAPTRHSATTDHADVGIAVLPFTPLSSDTDDRYVADGLTEELITALARVRSLRVIARGSVQPFRDRSHAPGEIARQLKVSHVLDGTVRRAGDRVRITASLIDVADSSTIWAERFDGQYTNIFDVQDAVANAVVTGLKLVLTPEESARVAEHPLTDPAAYDCYSRARADLESFTATGYERAFVRLEEAQRLVPDNVYVMRGLATACWKSLAAGVSTDRSLLERAWQYADAIADREPGSPYVDEIRGLVLHTRGDMPGAIRYLTRARAALPEDLDIAFWLAVVLAVAGLPTPSLSLLDEVQAREPMHPLAAGFRGLVLQFLGRGAEFLPSWEAPTTTVSIDAWSAVHGTVALSCDQIARAMEAFARGRQSGSGFFAAVCELYEGAIQGIDRTALLLNRAMTTWAEEDPLYAFWIADVYRLLRRFDKARDWLARAASVGFGIVDVLTHHYVSWRPLAGTSQFRDVVSEVARQRAANVAAFAEARRIF